MIKGINWWGTEGPSRVFGGLKSRSMDGLLDFIQEQGFNSIRILISHRAVMINGKIPAGEYDEGRTPELVNLRYLDQIQLMMRKAADRRLLVMINAHRTLPTAWPGEGMWYDSSVSEADAIRSWTLLATQFCSSWNFFAADLVNEPRKASWGRGGPADWNKAAERIGNAVLQTCPRLLIFVQGVAGDPGAQGDGGVSQGYFWGENLYGAHTAPVRLRDQSKLVYSPHTYGPGTVRQQSYFPTCTGGGCHSDGFPSNMRAIWDAHFGFVPELTKHAVVIGEFGGFYTGFDKQWQDTFVDYMIERGFGAFFFGLNPDSLDTGGLLRQDWRSEEHEKLGLIRRMRGTRVVTIIGEEPPSPEPPRPPPPPPPTLPPPLFSDTLLQLLKEKPPPPPPRSRRSAPPPDSMLHRYTSPPSPKAIILGGSSLVVGASEPKPKPVSVSSNSSFVSTTIVLACVVIVGLVVALLRWRSLGDAKRRALRAVRPKHRARVAAEPSYDRVAAEVEAAESSEDAGSERATRQAAREATPDRRHAGKRSARDCGLTQSSLRRVSCESSGGPQDKPADEALAPSTDIPREVVPAREGCIREPDAALAPGMQVRVIGLRRAQEHNSKEGVLISLGVKDNVRRWNLRLQTGELLALKPENLEVCGKAPSMQAMVLALERAGEYDKAALLRTVLPDQ